MKIYMAGNTATTERERVILYSAHCRLQSYIYILPKEINEKPWQINVEMKRYEAFLGNKCRGQKQ